MAKRALSPTKAAISRAVSGAVAGGIRIGEVRVLRDGSIVILPVGMTQPAILDDDLDAKLAAFANS